MREDATMPLILKSIATEAELARKWHETSRGLGQQRFATVFGSARVSKGDTSYDMARQLGGGLAGEGWAVLTGGGPGIMQAVRDGSGDHHSRAVRIEIAGEEPDTVLDSSRSITVASFALRKILLIHEIDVLFVFPGGVGTFDELLEVLVHQDTSQIRTVPVVLIEPEGAQIWSAWLRFMYEHLVEEGYVNATVFESVRVVKTVAEALEISREIGTGPGAAIQPPVNIVV